MKHWIAAGVVLGAIAAGQVSHAHRLYSSSEFGIRLLAPRGMSICPQPHDERDHGPMISLDGTIANCKDTSPGRFVEIFAGYIPDVQETLESELNTQCSGNPEKPCTEYLSSIPISGHRTKSGKFTDSNGSVNVYVITRSVAPPVSESPILYVCRLHTTKDRAKGDMKIFEKILKELYLK